MAVIGLLWGKCRNGTAPASRTACTALMCGAGSVPTVQLASTLSIGLDSGGALDFDRIGLVDGAGGKAPQAGGGGGLGVIADDGEQFGALAQAARIAAGGLRAGAECGQQFGVRDIAGLGDPAVTVLTGQSLRFWARWPPRRSAAGVDGVS